MTKPIDVNEFARFIGTTVAEARKILERAANDAHDIHDGYDYDKQEWVK